MCTHAHTHHTHRHTTHTHSENARTHARTHTHTHTHTHLKAVFMEYYVTKDGPYQCFFVGDVNAYGKTSGGLEPREFMVI